MTASSLVLRTRRRSCYQGRGDLHLAATSNRPELPPPDPRQLRRSTSPHSPSPGWSAATCSSVSTQHYTWIIRAEEAASRAQPLADPNTRSRSGLRHRRRLHAQSQVPWKMLILS